MAVALPPLPEVRPGDDLGRLVAEAWRNGRHYRLKIDDDNGRILARTRIR